MRHNYFSWILMLVLLSGCACNNAKAQPSGVRGTEAITAEIVFNGNAASVSGSGAEFSAGTLTISQAGAYALSGALDNGQVIINAGRNDTVLLILNGVSLRNETGPAILSNRLGELELALADGSQNTVSDSARPGDLDDSNELSAAIFVQNSLKISGGGSLAVNGNFKHGIRAQDFLTITGGEIIVNAAGDALRGRDGVIISGGSFVLNAGGDGIQSNNANSGDVGYVNISGGAFTIRAKNDGIQAESALTITGGSFNIICGGGSDNAPARTNNFRRGWGGVRSPPVLPEEESESMKGLKAGSIVNISGGDFIIDAEDDGIHSNGNILITSGAIYIKTGDDGIHADASVEITGGEINIPVCYEGIEGLNVTIRGGNIAVVSSDDAVNAAMPDSASQPFGGPAGRGRAPINENIFVRITGGTVDLYALADGIDSNGNIFLEGGAVKISGPSMGMEGAIDLDGTMLITGGELITAGSVINASSQSSQPLLLVSYARQQAAGSVIAVKDARGNTLLEHESRNAFSMSGFTSPFFKIGETYSLFINGEKRADIRLSNIITAIGDDGGAYSLRGGMQRRW